MGWILATVSKSEKKNWDLCKKFEIWGVPTQGEKDYIEKAKQNDFLLFWVGGVGFVGTGIAVENLRPTKSDAEIPWKGGMSRFGFILPFKLTAEFSEPVMFNFKSNMQLKTNIPLAYFRRGFQPITDLQAEIVLQESKLK
jgi:hypothetical protein